MIAENPFGEKEVSVRSNRSRDYFIPRKDAAKVLDACPDALMAAIVRSEPLRRATLPDRRTRCEVSRARRRGLLGHSTMVAQKHYWRTTDADFEKATELPEAVQNPVESAAISECNEASVSAELVGVCGNSDDFASNEHARQDSNLRPAD